MQRFEGVRLEGDDWHKGIVAVVNLVPEAELWSLNVPGCQQLHRHGGAVAARILQDQKTLSDSEHGLQTHGGCH